MFLPKERKERQEYWKKNYEYILGVGLVRIKNTNQKSEG